MSTNFRGSVVLVKQKGWIFLQKYSETFQISFCYLMLKPDLQVYSLVLIDRISTPQEVKRHTFSVFYFWFL